MDNLDAIIEVSDGIMVARGDLGVNQNGNHAHRTKEMIRKTSFAGKPVITATQMLDSMTKSGPTRASNGCCQCNTRRNRCSNAFGETAAGNYPVSCKVMHNIAIYYRRIYRVYG